MQKETSGLGPHEPETPLLYTQRCVAMAEGEATAAGEPILKGWKQLNGINQELGSRHRARSAMEKSTTLGYAAG